MGSKKEDVRVIAILRTEGNKVYSFGEGVYVGDEIPPKEAGGFNLGIPNPCIKLDSGKKVFGCECWWGKSEKVKKEILKDREVILVDIDKVRKELGKMVIAKALEKGLR